MNRLLCAGLLYLVGVSIILLVRPSLMFMSDGTWKEFGIGRNNSRYTWFPFWLFSILWAIISYILILTISKIVQKSAGITSVNISDITVDTISNNIISDSSDKIVHGKPNRMRPGYYVLNKEGTLKRGTPRYVYLGKEPPNFVYNNDAGEMINDVYDNIDHA